MTKKAIRVDCEKKIFYFIEIEISTYDKKVDSIKKELNTDSLIVKYLPGGELVFADEKHESIKDIENESNIFLGNLVIASNIDEDVNFTKEDIEELFGSEVAFLVDGVTKLNQFQYVTKEDQQLENYRKMGK